MAVLTEELLRSCKNYLDITWDDPDGDLKLSGIIMRGMNYLDDKSGGELAYEKERVERQLLFDYVRYARSNQLHEFEKNYLHDLVALQVRQVTGFG